METKDKWSIKIGGGYRTTKPKIRSASILTELLNFKYKTEKELATFCEKNKLYLFPSNGKSLVKIFEEQRKLLKEYSEKLLNRTFSEETITEINKHLGGPRINLAVLSLKELRQLNYSPEGLQSKQGQYLVFTKTYSSSFASLWEELIIRTLKEQTLGRCRNCTDFFIKTKRNSKGFCGDNCREKYSKKKRYHEKKASIESPR